MTGYPTPDNPAGDMEYVCKRVFLPNDAAFIACLYGQVYEMTRAYYWVQSGSMTPEEAAFYMSIAMAKNDIDEVCDMDCSDVANCILTDADVQAALLSFLNGAGFSGGAGSPTEPIPESEREGNILPASATCTDDNKYALALAVVQVLDRSIIDFLEIVELVTNPAEYAATLADNAGVWGALPAGAAETATWLQDTIQEAYEASYTSGTEEDFACAIACKITDCALSFDQIYEAYQEEAGVSLPDTDNLLDVVEFLVGLIDIPAKLVVGASHLLALSLLRWGSDWANIGSWRVIEVALAAVGADEILSPDCDCPTGEAWYEWDFTAGNGGWIIRPDTPNRGEYIASQGWVTDLDAGKQQLYIINENMTGVVIEEIQVQGTNYTSPDFTMDTKQIVMRDVYDSSSGQVVPFNSSGGNASEVCSTGETGLPGSRVTLGANYQVNSTTNRFVITKIAIRYTSGSPTGGSVGTGAIC